MFFFLSEFLALRKYQSLRLTRIQDIDKITKEKLTEDFINRKYLWIWKNSSSKFWERLLLFYIKSSYHTWLPAIPCPHSFLTAHRKVDSFLVASQAKRFRATSKDFNLITWQHHRKPCFITSTNWEIACCRNDILESRVKFLAFWEGSCIYIMQECW